MTKIAQVAEHLQSKGWIDGSTIKQITKTNCARDYIYDLKRRKGIVTVSHRITPTYTRWLSTIPHGAKLR